MKYKNVFDSILDENCTDVIYLEDKDHNKIAYEQIALIPYDNKLYAIMVEKELYDKGEENCGDVFYIDEKNKVIKIVNNVNIISTVFEIYDRMFDSMQEE